MFLAEYSGVARSSPCWHDLNEEGISYTIDFSQCKTCLLNELVRRGLLSSTDRKTLTNENQEYGSKENLIRLLSVLKKERSAYSELVNSVWTCGYWQLAEAVCQRCEQCLFDRNTSRMVDVETNSLEVQNKGEVHKA